MLTQQKSSAAGFQNNRNSCGTWLFIHSFLSPISNKRDDDYGGSYEERIKLLKI